MRKEEKLSAIVRVLTSDEAGKLPPICIDMLFRILAIYLSEERKTAG